jgi:hypothetical protein
MAAVPPERSGNNQQKKSRNPLAQVDQAQLREQLKTLFSNRRFLIVTSLATVLIIAGLVSLFLLRPQEEAPVQDETSQASARPVNFEPQNTFDIAGTYNKRCAYLSETPIPLCTLVIRQNGDLTLTTIVDEVETEYTGSIVLQSENENHFDITWVNQDGTTAETEVRAFREGTTLKLYYQSGLIFGFNVI